MSFFPTDSKPAQPSPLTRNQRRQGTTRQLRTSDHTKNSGRHWDVEGKEPELHEIDTNWTAHDIMSKTRISKIKNPYTVPGDFSQPLTAEQYSL
jgi:hypothetical protein